MTLIRDEEVRARTELHGFNGDRKVITRRPSIFASQLASKVRLHVLATLLAVGGGDNYLIIKCALIFYPVFFSRPLLHAMRSTTINYSP